MRTGILVFLTLSLTLFLSCRHDRKPGNADPLPEGHREIVLDGKLEDGQGMELILEEMAAREFIPLDTLYTGEDGSFAFRISNDHEAFYALRSEGGSYVTLLIRPGEHLKFQGSIGRSGHYSIQGSPGSILLQELSHEHKRVLEELSAIARQKSESHYDPNFVQLNLELERKFDSITAAFQAYSGKFIEDNQQSLAILIALYNLYGQGLPVFSPVENLDTYIFVDSLLMESHPESEFVRALHVHVNEAQSGRQRKTAAMGLNAGDIAPDFVSSRPDQSQVALSEFKGSYVLLCFWASWSQGSRDENLYLRRAWDRFGASGLSIVQVGFETGRDAWVKAIEDDRLDWVQLSDLRGWDSPLADLYQVERIPSNYLVGPEGVILERDLLGEELISRLDKFFD